MRREGTDWYGWGGAVAAGYISAPDMGACLGYVGTCRQMSVHVCLDVRFLGQKSHRGGLDMSCELRYTVYSDLCCFFGFAPRVLMA